MIVAMLSCRFILMFREYSPSRRGDGSALLEEALEEEALEDENLVEVEVKAEQ
ncbi:hypothetical protein LR48_Vigan05g003700 [Vigna angularis]|uniref:Uncharacterized protein n=1 Tax=Phaseolus angularis TaxID=3914 RepID=A0A0L9UI44_PHAAN|nr:hypothetical protein LR48_Vigan05g003700 [Vigna angularis]